MKKSLFILSLAFLASAISLAARLRADSTTGKTREHTLTEKVSGVPNALPWLTKLDRLEDETMDSVSMEPRVFQKRVFMSGRPGSDVPKDRHAYIPQGPGTETTEERKLYLDRFPSEPESDDQGKEHVLQKRVFMRGRPGGDAPKDRHAYVPEEQRFESAQERRMYEALASQEDDSENVHASDLKKLLIVRDRVRAIHEKLDSVIDRYQRNGESREKLVRGEDDLQFRKWEKILKGFVTD